MVVRKDLEEERTRSAMGLLGTMPVSLRAPQGLVERAWAIATELDRPTAYDSFYLGVAELSGIECWTADRPVSDDPSMRDARRGTGCRGARSDPGGRPWSLILALAGGKLLLRLLPQRPGHGPTKSPKLTVRGGVSRDSARSTSPPWMTWSPPDDPALDPAGGAR
jgi:hypothetical protein